MPKTDARPPLEALTQRELNWLIDLVRAQRLNDNSERGPLLLKLSAMAEERHPNDNHTR